jgi:hypothetical protein
MCLGGCRLQYYLITRAQTCTIIRRNIDCVRGNISDRCLVLNQNVSYTLLCQKVLQIMLLLSSNSGRDFYGRARVSASLEAADSLNGNKDSEFGK